MNKLIHNILCIPIKHWDKFYIAGGTLIKLFQNKLIKSYSFSAKLKSDIDLFITNQENYDIIYQCLKNYHSELIGTDKAFTFESRYDINGDYTKEWLNQFRIQLIKKTAMPEKQINEFDFTVCSCAFEPHIQKFTYVDTFFEDIRRKKLALNKSQKLDLSYFRIQKYAYSKGFKMDKELKKMIKEDKLCMRCKRRLQCITDENKKCAYDNYNF